LIVAEQKEIDEIIDSLRGYEKVVVASCGTCVTVCLSGGEKEALMLKSILLAEAAVNGRKTDISVVNCKRQCDHEFLDDLEEELLAGDVILSMGCGVGVQFLAEKYGDKPVLPGLNTRFYGAAKELGYWTEYCQGCGNCLLEKTGGVCPVARCSKSIFNGPCGGSQMGKCEIDPETDCAWQLIYEKLKAFDKLENLTKVFEPRDWSTSRDGGPRSMKRPDFITEEKKG
jgi:ferredoxin